jgi:guanylate cyclase
MNHLLLLVVMMKQLLKELLNVRLISLFYSIIHRNLFQGLAEILHEGGPDLYMQFFGECFVKFFTNYGYDKILRVAGRHFRDFLLSIDQLHDSTRFSFPKMKSPLFHVTEEDENGAVLHYK